MIAGKSLQKIVPLLTASFLSFLILFFPLPVWGEEMLIVNTQVLNVRSGPGVNFPLIGQVKLGREFKVEEEKNGWYRIKLSNGTVGWVIKDYVSMNYIELEIQEE